MFYRIKKFGRNGSWNRSCFVCLSCSIRSLSLHAWESKSRWLKHVHVPSEKAASNQKQNVAIFMIECACVCVCVPFAFWICFVTRKKAACTCQWALINVLVIIQKQSLDIRNLGRFLFSFVRILLAANISMFQSLTWNEFILCELWFDTFTLETQSVKGKI